MHRLHVGRRSLRVGRRSRLLIALLAAALLAGALAQGPAANVSSSGTGLLDKPSPFEWTVSPHQYVAPQSAGRAALAAIEARLAAHPEPAVSSPFAHIAAGAGTIVQNGQAPLPGFIFMGQNRWYEVKGGTTIIVMAGASGQDRSQGELVVEEAAQSYHVVSGPQFYRTPGRAGAVRIVGAAGERLTLASAQGATFTFDVAARAFTP